MRSQFQKLSNFTQAIYTVSECFRPDNEKDLQAIISHLHNRYHLARGAGLSYSDCCLNHQGIIVNCQRLNHLLSFDEQSGVLICQGGVTFADLFTIHPDYIPPVIPGTIYATLAGGIANDIHGKNNPSAGTLGQHIQWLELEQGTEVVFCSHLENKELFIATIGGLGLTGIIKRLAITLRRASHCVTVHREKYNCFAKLLLSMQQNSNQHDYQVAWLDLLNSSRALLSVANHCSNQVNPLQQQFTIPKLPLRLINHWILRQFNRYYYHQATNNFTTVPLTVFNSPLNKINHWHRLYGPKGFIQFQAVFAEEHALATLQQLIILFKQHNATPALAVLKYFTQPGLGLLSFAKPGFTIAIDFINNHQSQGAILAMNQFITEQGGRIYLAKDLLLTPSQFQQQYPHHQQFAHLCQNLQSKGQSNLSRRLGLTR